MKEEIKGAPLCRTPEHPFTAGELESAMYGVIAYIAGDPGCAAEVIREMGIPDEMATFFGYDPREEDS